MRQTRGCDECFAKGGAKALGVQRERGHWPHQEPQGGFTGLLDLGLPHEEQLIRQRTEQRESGGLMSETQRSFSPGREAACAWLAQLCEKSCLVQRTVSSFKLLEKQGKVEMTLDGTNWLEALCEEPFKLLFGIMKLLSPFAQ